MHTHNEIKQTKTHTETPPITWSKLRTLSECVMLTNNREYRIKLRSLRTIKGRRTNALSHILRDAHTTHQTSACSSRAMPPTTNEPIYTSRQTKFPCMRGGYNAHGATIMFAPTTPLIQSPTPLSFARSRTPPLHPQQRKQRRHST